MTSWVRRSMQLIVLAAMMGTWVFGGAHVASADHGSPDRVLDNTYVISMTAVFENRTANLKYYFRDIQTGKELTEPIQFTINVFKDGDAPPVYVSESLNAQDGIGEFTYTFPHPGIYLLRMDVVFASAPEKVYHPEEWSIWVPGDGTNPDRYPIGPTEISGFALLFLTLIVLAANVWWRKRQR